MRRTNGKADLERRVEKIERQLRAHARLEKKIDRVLQHCDRLWRTLQPLNISTRIRRDGE